LNTHIRLATINIRIAKLISGLYIRTGIYDLYMFELRCIYCTVHPASNEIETMNMRIGHNTGIKNTTTWIRRTSQSGLSVFSSDSDKIRFSRV